MVETPSQPVDSGEDMLQMALRMASDMSEEPVLDLEDSIQTNPIDPGQFCYLSP